MRIDFLGTGAAFSEERYNGAVVVDGRVLLDGGAPLLPHMHRLGLDPKAIEVVFLTHFHGDHVLGLPPFVLHRALVGGGPLWIVCPDSLQARMELLLELAWGSDWGQLSSELDLRYQEAASAGEVAGVAYETVRLDHGSSGCTGYRLRIGRRLLAYAGDSEATPPLDRLVEGAEVAIVEATGPGQVHSHTSWEDAARLRERHPGTIFYFNHVYSGSLEGAAQDLQTVNV